MLLSNFTPSHSTIFTQYATPHSTLHSLLYWTPSLQPTFRQCVQLTVSPLIQSHLYPLQSAHYWYTYTSTISLKVHLTCFSGLSHLTAKSMQGATHLIGANEHLRYPPITTPVTRGDKVGYSTALQKCALLRVLTSTTQANIFNEQHTMYYIYIITNKTGACYYFHAFQFIETKNKIL